MPIFIFLLVVSSTVWGGRPLWLSETEKFCGKAKLCAVGEGTGLMSAEANAYNSLAKIFSTRVESKLEIYESSSMKSDAHGPLSGESDETMIEKIKTSTDQLLKGVVIAEKFETPEGVFALAQLDKRKGAHILKTEMDEMDEKIKVLFKDGRRSSLNKILKKLKIRGRLNLRYQVLKTNSYLGPITYRQVMAKKALKRAQEVVLKVEFTNFKKSAGLKHFIINTFVDNDFMVVTKKNLPHQFLVKITIAREKRTAFKVKGFEKYKFHLKIIAERKGGRQQGALSFTSEKIGRNSDQAYLKAVPEIKNYINENLGELNID